MVVGTHGNSAGECEGLVAQVRAGDRSALDRLFARHEDYLRRVIGLRLDRRLRPRLGVSDVVQATQLDALERIDDYLAGEPLPFRWWLRKAAHERLRRVHRAHLRTGKRAVAREVPLPDRSSLQLVSRLAAPGPSPSRQAARRELAARVRRALARLPETDREILLMRDFEDLPYDEIAYVLRIESAAARMRHGRALIRLGQILREEGVTGS